MNAIVSKILIVGAGSCFGGMTRYLIGRAIPFSGHGGFPWGTFLVNVVGCFIIGLVYGLIDKGCQLSEGMKLFLTVGFCGGFTTFSSFMNENYLLFLGSEHLSVALYTVASLFVGFLSVYLAYSLVRVS
ncbi:MAG: CrcB family protein [Bacteroides sp.]|nr:CrcB family protein [Bacteroides sp.]MCM1085366.1 CrcB family protein [Bacteroides sp.]